MVNYRLLLTTDGYGKYSYLMVKIFGLKGAVYFEELIKQSIAKQSDTISPKYAEIENNLGITKEEQEKFLLAFSSVGLIKKADKRSFNIDFEKYFYITTGLTEEEFEVIKQSVVTKMEVSADRKTTKAEVLKNKLKANVLGNNEELRKLYFRWIEVVVDKFGYMTSETVIMGQKMASQAAAGVVTTEKAILEKAIINSYRDMSWAIKSFKDTLTIDGNLGSAKPITITTNSDNTKKLSDQTVDELIFGEVI